VELFVDLRRDAGGPFRRRLEREIREAVQAGRLPPGAALPSTRALAAQLGVSRGLVVETYAQLVAEGYLSARQGAGTLVAARADAGITAPAPAPRDGWEAPPHISPTAAARLAPPHASPTAAARPAPPHASPVPRYDFRTGVPDLSAFPRAAWLTAGARTLRALPDARLGYGDARGAIELRESLAAYLGRVRGAVADPERLLVGGGTCHGLMLVWHLLAAAGARRVAIEDPGWRAQHETAIEAGLETVAVAVDERGLRVEELAALDVDAVVLTPAHQFPTGVALAPERRAALLEWARRSDAIIVEDDYDAEYRYDRDPVGALQGMAPERVVYAGSASKTLAPALRLGWLLLPAALAEPAACHRALADRGEPLLAQLTFADLVAHGELDRHLRRTRRRYRARRDALVGAVAGSLPGASVEGIAAGLHAVVRLPDGSDEGATVLAAAARGIALEGLGSFHRAGTSAHPSLVLGYANLPEPAIVRGITELAAVMR
jgi:GntR family transcriptional regulator/MocR family aminotransferase